MAKKKEKELPKWTARNKHAIQIVKVTKRNGKPVGKELLYFWRDNTLQAYRNAISFFEGMKAGWEEFANNKSELTYIEFPSCMSHDGYHFHNHRFYDWHGEHGEDIGSGISFRLEKRDGKLVTGKDAWPEKKPKPKATEETE